LTEQLKHRILIADDEDDLRTLLGDLLTGAHYDVIYAADGEEAIAQIRSHKPDLALLDIQMPRLNGIEVLKYISQNCPSLHVIMLTGFADLKYAMEAREFGAHDFISKPYKVDDMLATIARLLTE
jgi:DNA-binding NtrC family response regulator